MWSRNASDGKTYEESIKKTLLDDLKNMALLEEHMKDYDVKLTKADKKAINDAAKEFDKANSQKKKDKVSGSKENVKRVMTLMVIEQKMRSAIVAEANVNVTDEDAANAPYDEGVSSGWLGKGKCAGDAIWRDVSLLYPILAY